MAASAQDKTGTVNNDDLYQPKRRTNRLGVQVEETRICVVMVGLPARGKSLIAQKGEFEDATSNPLRQE